MCQTWCKENATTVQDEVRRVSRGEHGAEWKEWYLRYKPLKIQLKEIVALNEELAMKSADSNFGPGIDGRVSFTPPRT